MGYNNVLSYMPDIDYSLDQVAELFHDKARCNSNSRFVNNAGIYFSALINNVIKPDDKITLKIGTEDKDKAKIFENLGVFHSKGTLEIIGNVYGDIGYKISGGEIIIKGNVFGPVGQKMMDGKIFIDGDIFEYKMETGICGVGQEMEGGELYIQGNAKLHESTHGGGLGCRMRGGKITINGDVHHLAYKMNGGEIIINGNSENVNSHIGKFMNGGIIKFNGVGRGHIGIYMRGGKIVIKKIAEREKESGEGLSIGFMMRDGIIEVEGDANNAQIGAQMENGKILIWGNAYSHNPRYSDVGERMKGGEIHITGNVNKEPGDEMEGGTIKIDGEMPRRKSFFGIAKKKRLGGEIIYKGRRI